MIYTLHLTQRWGFLSFLFCYRATPSSVGAFSWVAQASIMKGLGGLYAVPRTKVGQLYTRQVTFLLYYLSSHHRSGFKCTETEEKNHLLCHCKSPNLAVLRINLKESTVVKEALVPLPAGIYTLYFKRIRVNKQTKNWVTTNSCSEVNPTCAWGQFVAGNQTQASHCKVFIQALNLCSPKRFDVQGWNGCIN